MKFKKCCICGRLIDGYPHNAEPYRKGVCCGQCNASIVLPTRLNYQLKRKKY